MVGLMRSLRKFEKDNDIPDDVTVIKALIRQRMKHNGIVLMGYSGSVSPLLSIEPQIVAILI